MPGLKLDEEGRTAQEFVEVLDVSGTARGNASCGDGVIEIHEDFAKIKNNNWNHIMYLPGRQYHLVTPLATSAVPAKTESPPFSEWSKHTLLNEASLMP